VRAREEQGPGPPRLVLAPAPAGEEALREEWRGAMRLLLEAFDARSRARARKGRARGRVPRVRGPLVFVSGSRFSAVEQRILAALAEAMPRRVHLALPPGVPLPDPPGGVAVVEAPWAALPFRDGYAGLLMVNELPPAPALPRAAREWRRVLAPGGTLHVIAPAPLPRGVDPFVDFLAELHDELYPDQAGAPSPEEVGRALRHAFGNLEEGSEANQRVWTCKR
jgi:SAM-dependent methyltransferase